MVSQIHSSNFTQFQIMIFKEPYRIWELFWTPPNGPFFLPKKLKKYTKL